MTVNGKPNKLDKSYWDYVDEVAQKYGVPRAVWEGIVGIESSHGANPAVSPKGARGVWQIMPATAKGLGINPDDPYQAAEGALRLIRDNYLAFRDRARDEMHAWQMATAAYQTNPKNIKKDLDNGGWGIPNWVNDGANTPFQYTKKVFKNITPDKLDRKPQGSEKFIAPRPTTQDAQVDVPNFTGNYQPPRLPADQPIPPQYLPDAGLAVPPPGMGSMEAQTSVPSPQAPAPAVPDNAGGVMQQRRARRAQESTPQVTAPIQEGEGTEPAGTPVDWQSIVPEATNATLQGSDDDRPRYNFENSGALGDLTYIGKDKGFYRFHGKNPNDIYRTYESAPGKLADLAPEDDNFLYFQGSSDRWSRTGDNEYTNEKNGQRILRQDKDGNTSYSLLNLPNVFDDPRGKTDNKFSGQQMTVVDDPNAPTGWQTVEDVNRERYYTGIDKPIIPVKDYQGYLDHDKWLKSLPDAFQKTKEVDPRKSQLGERELDYQKFIGQYGLDDTESAAQWFGANSDKLDRATKATFMRPTFNIAGTAGKDKQPTSVALSYDTNQSGLDGDWFRYKAPSGKTYISDGQYTVEESSFRKDLTPILAQMPSGYFETKSQSTFSVNLGADQATQYKDWRKNLGIKQDTDRMRQLFLDSGGTLPNTFGVVTVKGDEAGGVVAQDELGGVAQQMAREQINAIGTYQNYLAANTRIVTRTKPANKTAKIGESESQAKEKTKPADVDAEPEQPKQSILSDAITEREAGNPIALRGISKETAVLYAEGRKLMREMLDPNLSEEQRASAKAQLTGRGGTNEQLAAAGIAPIVDPTYGNFTPKTFLAKTIGIGKDVKQDGVDAKTALINALMNNTFSGIQLTREQAERAYGQYRASTYEAQYNAAAVGTPLEARVTYAVLNAAFGGDTENMAPELKAQFSKYFVQSQTEILNDLVANNPAMGQYMFNNMRGMLDPEERQARAEVLAEKEKEARARQVTAKESRGFSGGDSPGLDRMMRGTLESQVSEDDKAQEQAGEENAARLKAYANLYSIEHRYGSALEYKRKTETESWSAGLDRSGYGGWAMGNMSDALEWVTRKGFYAGKHITEGVLYDGPVMLMSLAPIAQSAWYSLQMAVQSTKTLPAWLGDGKTGVNNPLYDENFANFAQEYGSAFVAPKDIPIFANTALYLEGLETSRQLNFGWDDEDSSMMRAGYRAIGQAIWQFAEAGLMPGVGMSKALQAERTGASFGVLSEGQMALRTQRMQSALDIIREAELTEAGMLSKGTRTKVAQELLEAGFTRPDIATFFKEFKNGLGKGILKTERGRMISSAENALLKAGQGADATALTLGKAPIRNLTGDVEDLMPLRGTQGFEVGARSITKDVSRAQWVAFAKSGIETFPAQMYETMNTAMDKYGATPGEAFLFGTLGGFTSFLEGWSEVTSFKLARAFRMMDEASGGTFSRSLMNRGKAFAKQVIAGGFMESMGEELPQGLGTEFAAAMSHGDRKENFKKAWKEVGNIVYNSLPAAFAGGFMGGGAAIVTDKQGRNMFNPGFTLKLANPMTGSERTGILGGVSRFAGRVAEKANAARPGYVQVTDPKHGGKFVTNEQGLVANQKDLNDVERQLKVLGRVANPTVEQQQDIKLLTARKNDLLEQQRKQTEGAFATRDAMKEAEKQADMKASYSVKPDRGLSGFTRLVFNRDRFHNMVMDPETEEMFVTDHKGYIANSKRMSELKGKLSELYDQRDAAQSDAERERIEKEIDALDTEHSVAHATDQAYKEIFFSTNPMVQYLAADEKYVGMVTQRIQAERAQEQAGGVRMTARDFAEAQLTIEQLIAKERGIELTDEQVANRRKELVDRAKTGMPASARPMHVMHLVQEFGDLSDLAGTDQDTSEVQARREELGARIAEFADAQNLTVQMNQAAAAYVDSVWPDKATLRSKAATSIRKALGLPDVSDRLAHKERMAEMGQNTEVSNDAQAEADRQTGYSRIAGEEQGGDTTLVDDSGEEEAPPSPKDFEENPFEENDNEENNNEEPVKEELSDDEKKRRERAANKAYPKSAVFTHPTLGRVKVVSIEDPHADDPVIRVQDKKGEEHVVDASELTLVNPVPNKGKSATGHSVDPKSRKIKKPVTKGERVFNAVMDAIAANETFMVFFGGSKVKIDGSVMDIGDRFGVTPDGKLFLTRGDKQAVIEGDNLKKLAKQFGILMKDLNTFADTKEVKDEGTGDTRRRSTTAQQPDEEEDDGKEEDSFEEEETDSSQQQGKTTSTPVKLDKNGNLTGGETIVISGLPKGGHVELRVAQHPETKEWFAGGIFVLQVGTGTGSQIYYGELPSQPSREAALAAVADHWLRDFAKAHTREEAAPAAVLKGMLAALQSFRDGLNVASAKTDTQTTQQSSEFSNRTPAKKERGGKDYKIEVGSLVTMITDWYDKTPDSSRPGEWMVIGIARQKESGATYYFVQNAQGQTLHVDSSEIAHTGFNVPAKQAESLYKKTPYKSIDEVKKLFPIGYGAVAWNYTIGSFGSPIVIGYKQDAKGVKLIMASYSWPDGPVRILEDYAHLAMGLTYPESAADRVGDWEWEEEWTGIKKVDKTFPSGSPIAMYTERGGIQVGTVVTRSYTGARYPIIVGQTAKGEYFGTTIDEGKVMGAFKNKEALEAQVNAQQQDVDQKIEKAKKKYPVNDIFEFVPTWQNQKAPTFAIIAYYVDEQWGFNDNNRKVTARVVTLHIKTGQMNTWEINSQGEIANYHDKKKGAVALTKGQPRQKGRLVSSRDNKMLWDGVSKKAVFALSPGGTVPIKGIVGEVLQAPDGQKFVVFENPEAVGPRKGLVGKEDLQNGFIVPLNKTHASAAAAERAGNVVSLSKEEMDDEFDPDAIEVEDTFDEEDFNEDDSEEEPAAPEVQDAVQAVNEQPVNTPKTVFAGDIKTQVDPRVISADDLLTSDEPGYPAELQPRNTGRKASAAFISKIANELDPERLDDESFAGNGRPIAVPVTVNGKTKYAVIAGNHRVAAIRQRYAKGDNQQYQGFAESKDANSTAAQPVYVGVIFNPESIDLVGFARAANEAQQRGMSATEQGVQDAGRLTADMLSALMVGEDGNLNNQANMNFIRKFLQMVGQERASTYLRSDGMLNQDGVRAMRNAVFAAAYGQTAEGLNLLEQMSESEDANIKRIISALLTVAPRFAQMKADIAAGAAYPVMDISAALGRAATKMATLREQGMSVAEFSGQQSLFADLTFSTMEMRLLQVLDTYKNSAKALRSVLNNYLGAAAALGAPNQINMFGEINPNPLSVLQGVLEDYETANNQGKEVDLFSAVQNTAASEDAGEGSVAETEATASKPNKKERTKPGRKGVKESPSKMVETARSRMTMHGVNALIQFAYMQAQAKAKQTRIGVELNAHAAAVVNMALQLIYPGAETNGVFLKGLDNEKQADRLVNVLRGMAQAQEDKGELEAAEAIRQLADTIAKSRDKDGSVVVYLFDKAVTHERLHYLSFLHAASKALIDRHDAEGLKTLLGSDEFKKAWDHYLESYVVEGSSTATKEQIAEYRERYIEVLNELERTDLTDERRVNLQRELAVMARDIGDAVEEVMAWSADGEYAQFGLTADEAARYLDNWLTSYERTNGVQLREKFLQESRFANEIQDRIAETHDAINNLDTYEQYGGDVSTVAGEWEGTAGREIDPSFEDEGGAEETIDPEGPSFQRNVVPSGENRLSAVPVTSADRMGIPLEDRLYVKTTTADIRNWVDSVVNQGLEHATMEFFRLAALKDLQRGGTIVLGETLAYVYEKRGDKAQAEKIYDVAQPWLTEMGQALSFFGNAGLLDPKRFTNRMKRVYKQLQNADMPQHLVDLINEAAQKTYELTQEGVALENAASILTARMQQLLEREDAMNAATAKAEQLQKKLQKERKAYKPGKEKATPEQLKTADRIMKATEVITGGNKKVTKDYIKQLEAEEEDNLKTIAEFFGAPGSTTDENISRMIADPEREIQRIVDRLLEGPSRMTVYHGTGAHRIHEEGGFKADFIGSANGLAYGWGHYVADLATIAKGYRQDAAERLRERLQANGLVLELNGVSTRESSPTEFVTPASIERYKQYHRSSEVNEEAIGAAVQQELSMGLNYLRDYMFGPWTAEGAVIEIRKWLERQLRNASFSIEQASSLISTYEALKAKALAGEMFPELEYSMQQRKVFADSLLSIGHGRAVLGAEATDEDLRQNYIFGAEGNIARQMDRLGVNERRLNALTYTSDFLDAHADKLTLRENKITEPVGAVYTLELAPTKEEMLFLDGTFAKQSAHTQQALANDPFYLEWEGQLLASLQTTTQEEFRGTVGVDQRNPQSMYKFYNWLARRFSQTQVSTDRLLKGARIDWGGDRLASMYLLSLGIRGNQFFNGIQRSTAGQRGGPGLYNYVIFDDADLAIVGVNHYYDREHFFNHINREGLFTNIANHMADRDAPLQLKGVHDFEKQNEVRLPRQAVPATSAPSVLGTSKLIKGLLRSTPAATERLSRELKDLHGDDLLEALKREVPEEGLSRQIVGIKGIQRLADAGDLDARATLNNLPVAKQMYAEGLPAQKIWMATGWEPGIDGNWKTELTPPPIDLNKVSARPGEQIWLPDAIVDGPYKTRLLNAYPDLRGVILAFDRRSTAGSGAHFGNRSRIELDAVRPLVPSNSAADGWTSVSSSSVVTPGDIASAVHHEIQHFVQAVEGFENGGSDAEFAQLDNPGMLNTVKNYQRFERNYNTIDAAIKDFDTHNLPKDQEIIIPETLHDPWTNQPFLNEDGTPATKWDLETLKQLRRDYRHARTDSDIKDEHKNAKPYVRLPLSKVGSAFDAYWALAGEVEARNVQARMPLPSSDDFRVSMEAKMAYMQAIPAEKQWELAPPKEIARLLKQRAEHQAILLRQMNRSLTKEGYAALLDALPKGDEVVHGTFNMDVPTVDGGTAPFTINYDFEGARIMSKLVDANIDFDELRKTVPPSMTADRAANEQWVRGGRGTFVAHSDMLDPAKTDWLESATADGRTRLDAFAAAQGTEEVEEFGIKYSTVTAANTKYLAGERMDSVPPIYVDNGRYLVGEKGIYGAFNNLDEAKIRASAVSTQSRLGPANGKVPNIASESVSRMTAAERQYETMKDDVFGGMPANTNRLFFADMAQDVYVGPPLFVDADVSVRFDGAQFYLSEGADGYVKIVDFQATPDTIGTGKGRKALRALIAYADRNGITLYGDPVASQSRGKGSKKGLRQSDLEAFYSRNGFTPVSKETIESNRADDISSEWIEKQPESISRMAKKDASDRKAPGLEAVNELIPQDVRVATKHTPGTKMTMVDGKDFLDTDLTRPGRNFKLTDKTVEKIWQSVLAASAKDPDGKLWVQKLLDNGMVPHGAEFWNAALKLSDRARYWYEISSEAFKKIFVGVTDDQLKTIISVISATSPSATPLVNIRRAIGVYSEMVQNQPIDTDLIDVNALEKALADSIDGLKTASFAGTMQYILGLTETKPLSTNDRQVAKSFNITGEDITKNSAVYEVMSRFYMELRDHLNAQLKPGEQPYETWQLQALGWVEQRMRDREATNDDYLQALTETVIPQLKAAGIIEGDTIPFSAFQNPKTPNVMSTTRERARLAPVGLVTLMDQNSKLGQRVLEAANKAIEVGTVRQAFGNNEGSLKTINQRYFDLLADRRSADDKSVATHIMQMILGSRIGEAALPDGVSSAKEITRVRTGEVVRDDTKEHALRLPLHMLTENERRVFLAIMGHTLKQSSITDARFAPAEFEDEPLPGHIRTASLFVGTKLTPDQVAEFQQRLGMSIHTVLDPHGVRMDVVPQNAAPVDIDEIQSLAGEMFGDKVTIMAKDYKATRIEQSEYKSIFKEFENSVKESAVNEIKKLAKADSADIRVPDIRKYVKSVVDEHIAGRDGSAIKSLGFGAKANERGAASKSREVGQRISNLYQGIRAAEFVLQAYEEEVKHWFAGVQNDIDYKTGKKTWKKRNDYLREVWQPQEKAIAARRKEMAKESISRSVSGPANRYVPTEMAESPEGVSRMANVNQGTPLKVPDRNVMEALIKVMTLRLQKGLINKPVSEFVKELKALTNNALPPQTMAEIHQKAVENVRVRRAKASDQKKADAKARRAHYKAADRFADVQDDELQGRVADFLREVHLERQQDQERIGTLTEALEQLKTDYNAIIDQMNQSPNASDRAVLDGRAKAVADQMRTLLEELNTLRNKRTPSDNFIAMLAKLHDDPLEFGVAYQLQTIGFAATNEWLGKQGYSSQEALDLLRRADALIARAKDELAKVGREAKAGRELTQREHENIKMRTRANRSAKQKQAAQSSRLLKTALQGKGVTIAQGVVDFMRANLLLHPAVWTVNTTSNLANALTDVPVAAIATLADRYASSKTGTRTTTLSLKGLMQGFKAVFADDETLKALDRESGMKFAWKMLMEGDVDSLAALQLTESGLKLVATSKLGKGVATIFDVYINTVFRFQGAQDALFKVYAFRKELENLAHVMAMNEGGDVAAKTKKLLANPTEVMAHVAMTEALKLTFQENNPVSDLLARGRSGLRNFRKLGNTGAYAAEATQVAIPFDRTPTNLILQALTEFTPIGFARAVREWKKMSRAMNEAELNDYMSEYGEAVSKDFAPQMELLGAIDINAQLEFMRAQLEHQFKFMSQKAFAKLMGRATLGTGGLILGIILGALGLLKGYLPPPDDRDSEEKQDSADRIEGLEKEGEVDDLFQLPQSPFFMAMFVGATMGATYNNRLRITGTTNMNRADAALTAGTTSIWSLARQQPLLETTLAGLAPGSLGAAVGARASTLIPGGRMWDLAGDVSDAVPRRRTTASRDAGESVTSKFARDFGTSFGSRFPGLRQNVEPDDRVSPGRRGGAGIRLLRGIKPLGVDVNWQKAFGIGPYAPQPEPVKGPEDDTPPFLRRKPLLPSQAKKE